MRGQIANRSGSPTGCTWDSPRASAGGRDSAVDVRRWSSVSMHTKRSQQRRPVAAGTVQPTAVRQLTCPRAVAAEIQTPIQSLASHGREYTAGASSHGELGTVVGDCTSRKRISSSALGKKRTSRLGRGRRGSPWCPASRRITRSSVRTTVQSRDHDQRVLCSGVIGSSLNSGPALAVTHCGSRDFSAQRSCCVRGPPRNRAADRADRRIL